MPRPALAILALALLGLASLAACQTAARGTPDLVMAPRSAGARDSAQVAASVAWLAFYGCSDSTAVQANAGAVRADSLLRANQSAAPRVGWTACEVVAAIGWPEREEQIEQARGSADSGAGRAADGGVAGGSTRIARWWYRDRRYREDTSGAVHLVELERVAAHGDSLPRWVVRYVGW